MRTFKCSILLLCLVLLSGCWDRMEINDLAFVTGTALDLGEDGRLFCTLQIAIPGSKESGSGGGGGGHDGNFYLISASGTSGSEIHRALQKKSSRRLFYSHRSIVLISERLAEHGIHEALLDVFTHDPRNRLKTYILLVKGSDARSVLSLNYPLKQVAIEAVNELQNSGDDLAVTLRDFFITVQSKGIQPIAGVVELGDRPEDPREQVFKSAGTGIIKDYKLVGGLDERETAMLMWMMDKLKFRRFTTTMPDEHGKIGMIFNYTDGKISTKFEHGAVHFKVLLKGTGIVEENNSDLDIGNPNQLPIIKHAVEDNVKQQAEQLIRKLQKKYKADSIGFGQEIYKNYPKEWQRLEKQWEAMYPEAHISVEVNLTINGAGMVHSTFEKTD